MDDMLLLQNSRACYKIHIASFSTSDTCNITGDAKLYIPIGGTASLAFWTCYKAFFLFWVSCKADSLLCGIYCHQNSKKDQCTSFFVMENVR